MRLLLTIIYLIATTSGMVLMKMGGNSLSLVLKNGLEFKIGNLTFFGFVLYAISFLLWQRLLITYSLSYIVPITTGIVQIIVLIVGTLIFKESINIYNIVGILLLIVGMFFISFKSN